MKIIILSILMLSQFLVQANDGPYKMDMSSQTAIPVHNDYIKIVRANTEYKNTIITNEVILKNDTSESQTVLLGYPVINNRKKIGCEQPEWSWNKEFTEKDIKQYYMFQTTINDINVDRKIIKLENKNFTDYGYIYSFEYNFKPNEIINIKNIYRVIPVGISDSLGIYDSSIELLLNTGATWKKSQYYEEIVFNINPPRYIPYDLDNFKSFNFLDIFFYGRYRQFYINTEITPHSIIRDDKLLRAKWIFKDGIDKQKIVLNWGVGYNKNEIELSAFNLAASLIDFESNDNKTINDLKKQLAFFNNKVNLNKYLDSLYTLIIGETSSVSENSPFDKEMIVILCHFYNNAKYAYHGHNIKSPTWQKYFSKLDWFDSNNSTIPIPNNENIRIKSIEKIIIEMKNK